MGEGSLHRPRLADPDTQQARKFGRKNPTDVTCVIAPGWLGGLCSRAALALLLIGGYDALGQHPPREPRSGSSPLHT